MDINRLLANAQDMLSEAQGSMSSSYDRTSDRVLNRLGLQHKRATSDMVLPALGILGAGIAVGAVLGLLFAPQRGDETRTELLHRLEDLRDRVKRTEDVIDQSASAERAPVQPRVGA